METKTDFRAFDGFACLARCGKRKKLVRRVGDILCDQFGEGWSCKSKSKIRQFAKSSYRWQIMRNFLMAANDRMMFGEEPDSWREYLINLADRIFKREMLTVQFGSRTKHLVKARDEMMHLFNSISEHNI